MASSPHPWSVVYTVLYDRHAKRVMARLAESRGVANFTESDSMMHEVGVIWGR